MKHYKELLLTKLAESGWELIEQNDDTDWWLEESWKIRSIKQNYGHEVFVLFLVAPMYEGNNKSQAVWAICAATSIPLVRPISGECFVEMNLQKGHFNTKINEFVSGVNRHREVVCL